jgi:carboxyl-terminal processing protease
MKKKILWMVASVAIVFGSIYVTALNAPALFGAGGGAHQLLMPGPGRYASGAPEKFDGKFLYHRAWEAFRDFHKELADPANMAKFAEWEHKFDTTDDLKTEEGTDRAIKMMRDSLGQRFDYFLTPEGTKAEQQQVRSDLVGIGVQVSIKGVDEQRKALGEEIKARKKAKNPMPKDEIVNRLKAMGNIGPGREMIVVGPIEGSPAFNILKKDDVISEVDGVSLEGKTLDAATNLIKGKPDTKVSITISRLNEQGEAVKNTYTFTRKPIERHAVHMKVVENKAVIKVDDFMAENLPEDFAKAVAKADEKNIGIVVDLRNNPGGALSSVLEMMANVINRGELMLQIERVPGTNVILYNETHVQNGFMMTVQRTAANPDRPRTQAGERPPLLLKGNKPIVVLINGGSASASEIFAGAIQANKRGKVVGTPSIGKGVGQVVLDLPYGRRLHITTFEFLPGGMKSDWIGVIPDIEVPITPEDIKAGRDPQLDAALKQIDDEIADNAKRTERSKQTLEEHHKRFDKSLKQQKEMDALPLGAEPPDVDEEEGEE